MQEEVEQRVVTLAINCTKLTEQELKKALAYLHSEKDILKLVTALIANTKGEGKAGDDF